MQYIIFKDLVSIRDLMDQNSDLFQRLVVHPSTNFPGRTQEGVLMQLLRKKPEPDVQEIAERGRQRGMAVAFPDGPPPSLANGANGANGSAPAYVPSQATLAAARTEEVPSEQLTALRSMWTEMRNWMQARVIKYATEEANEIYTVAERDMGIENVRTGLRRNLDWDSDEGEDDEDGSGEGSSAQKGAMVDGVATEKSEFIDPERILSFSVKLDWDMPANFDFESKRPKARANQPQRR